MILIGTGILACLIGLVLLTVLTTHLFIEVRAMQKSTHQVQFVRSNEFEKLNEELKTKLEKEFFDNLQ